MTIGELLDRRSALRAEHNIRNAEMTKLRILNSAVLREIREITYKIQDLQRLPLTPDLNLNDVKGDK